ncbi:hypothetical protein GGF50DRAFT_105981 [Schizophyllum commune]
MSSTPSLNSSAGSSTSGSKRPKPQQRRRAPSPPSMYVAYDSSRAKAPRPLPEVKRKPKKETKSARDQNTSDSSLSRSQTSESSSKSGTTKSKSLFGLGGLRRKTSTSLSPPAPQSPPPPRTRGTIPFDNYSRNVRQQPSLSSLPDSSHDSQWTSREASQSSLPSMYTHSSQPSVDSYDAWLPSNVQSRPSTAHSSSSSFSSMLPTPPEEEMRRRQLIKASQLLGTSERPDDLASSAIKVRPAPLVIASEEEYHASRLQPASEEPESITPTNANYDDDPYAALERASYSSSMRLSPMIFSAPAVPNAPAAPSPPSPIAVVADPESPSSDSDGDAIREVPILRETREVPAPVLREVSVIAERMQVQTRELPAVAAGDVAAAIATSPATPTFAPRAAKRHSKSFSIGHMHTQRPRTPAALLARPDTPFADYVLDDGYATDGGLARGDEKYDDEKGLFHSAVTAGEMEFLAMARRDAAVIKRDKRQNWSGEWNQNDMQEVIHKLRCLR